jgi:hypothetical protein
MLPITYSVEGASTDAQVAQRMSSLLDYLHSCHIDSLLPRRCSGLAAHNADEVRLWAVRLGQDGKDTYGLTAAGHCWLEELREAFAAAAKRLDEIATAHE